MSVKLGFEAVLVVTMVLFATAFAVRWKDCGEHFTSCTFWFTSG